MELVDKVRWTCELITAIVAICINENAATKNIQSTEIKLEILLHGNQFSVHTLKSILFFLSELWAKLCCTVNGHLNCSTSASFKSNYMHFLVNYSRKRARTLRHRNDQQTWSNQIDGILDSTSNWDVNWSTIDHKCAVHIANLPHCKWVSSYSCVYICWVFFSFSNEKLDVFSAWCSLHLGSGLVFLYFSLLVALFEKKKSNRALPNMKHTNEHGIIAMYRVVR